jgi:hypothetical protein
MRPPRLVGASGRPLNFTLGAPMRTRGTVLALAVMVATLAAHSLGLAGDATPSLSSTYPLLLIVPLGFLGVPTVLIALIFGACFILWSSQLFHGRFEIPRRSLVLFVISALLSCILFVVGWRFGLQYQGRSYVFWSATLAAAGAALMILLLEWNRRAPSVANSVLFHFVLFAWLCTFAMPWLGETP